MGISNIYAKIGAKMQKKKQQEIDVVPRLIIYRSNGRRFRPTDIYLRYLYDQGKLQNKRIDGQNVNPFILRIYFAQVGNWDACLACKWVVNTKRGILRFPWRRPHNDIPPPQFGSNKIKISIIYPRTDDGPYPVILFEEEITVIAFLLFACCHNGAHNHC